MSAQGVGFCPSCGAKRATGSRSCASCGFDFGETSPPEAPKDAEPVALDSLPPPPPPKPAGGIAGWGGRQWAIGGGVAAAALGGILAIVLIAGGDEPVPLQPLPEPSPVVGPATGLSPSPGFGGVSPEVAAAAERISCTDVEEDPDQTKFHEEPYAQGMNGVPAIGGNHTPAALPSEPNLLTEQPPEESAVHNLEHGYVIVYFALEGDNPLEESLFLALYDLIGDEPEVLLAPYDGLAQPLYLTAWGARRACAPPPGSDPEDVLLVARAFIEEWRNGPYAPEPAAS